MTDDARFQDDIDEGRWIQLMAADEDNYEPLEGLVEPFYDEPNEYESDPVYSATFIRR